MASRSNSTASRLTTALLLPILMFSVPCLTATTAMADVGTQCLLTTCPIVGGDGVLVVGDVETSPGGGRIAYNTPDPLLEWRLMNPCISEDGGLGGCVPQPNCPAPPDRVIHNFEVQYRPIAAGPAAGWTSDGIHCVDITEVQTATVTPAMVQAQFEQLPLPAGEVTLQPADGIALVNAGLIPFTTQDPDAPYDVDILGQNVHIDAYVTTYQWAYGDGSTGSGRGAAYPDTSTLHVYTHAGGYTLTLTLTWDATYTVAGGPVQDMPDTTTTQSPPLGITVVEADSILVDGFG